MKRFELVCAKRSEFCSFGLPLYIGTKVLSKWGMELFPKGTVFEDKGEYVTAFFTSKSGVEREIDIFEEGGE